MLFSDLISPERVLPLVRTSSKKRLLELISEALVRNDPSLDNREVFESLCARERLGSTGLGSGVAIPHGRIKGSDTPQAVFVRLAKPISFDAVDDQPVDLLLALAVPKDCTGDHLKLLAQIAEAFSEESLLEKLRTAGSTAEIVELLSGQQH